MILITDLEAWLEVLVEVSAGADTFLVFVNELSALLSIDFPNSLSALLHTADAFRRSTAWFVKHKIL